jgi:hypothetical protein
MLVGGREAAASRSLAEECAAAVRGLPGVHAYPPVAVGGPGARRPRWSVVIKGPDELPRLLAEPLRAWLERGRRTSGMVEVDMDPVAFP